MADEKAETSTSPSAQAVAPNAAGDRPLGQILAEARERRGLTREDVLRETHLPAHYVAMIETDNYGAIADQLYVLPFLRRYATFLGMDAEEVASRFVRDVQRAEVSVQRITDPIKMVERRARGRWGQVVLVALVTVAAIIIADIAIRRLKQTGAIKSTVDTPASEPSSMPAAVVSSEAQPASAPEAPAPIQVPNQPENPGGRAPANQSN